MVNYSLPIVFYLRSKNIFKKAIDFTLSEVNIPVLNHPGLSKERKFKVTNNKVRINSFKNMYDSKIYKVLKNKRLRTYKDIYPTLSGIFTLF